MNWDLYGHIYKNYSCGHTRQCKLTKINKYKLIASIIQEIKILWRMKQFFTWAKPYAKNQELIMSNYLFNSLPSNTQYIIFLHFGDSKLINMYKLKLLNLDDKIALHSLVCCWLTFKWHYGHFSEDEWQRILLCRTKVQLFIFGILNRKGISCTIVWPPMSTSRF